MDILGRESTSHPVMRFPVHPDEGDCAGFHDHSLDLATSVRNQVFFWGPDDKKL
jgi:hypothetical protein